MAGWPGLGGWAGVQWASRAWGVGGRGGTQRREPRSGGPRWVWGVREGNQPRPWGCGLGAKVLALEKLENH